MRKISLSSLMISALILSVISACGGGGGGGGGGIPQPTTAALTLSTAVTGTIPAGTTVNSYDVTVTLPAGVTVKSANPPETDAGVVTASGNALGATITGVYTAATGTFPGTVKIFVASASGFDAGEFCKVNGDIAAGYHPTASDFTQPTLDDATGIDASVSTVILTGELSLTSTVVIN
jgi:hypothetical protein